VKDVLVRHILSHTSGVSAWAQPVVVADIYDWDKSTSMLAAQAPWWKAGEFSGYHALNQGHLVGEVVRRITGSMLGAFLAEELTGPLGADFHIGLAESEFGRVANVIAPPPPPFDMASLDPEIIAVKTFTGPAPAASESWTPQWRQADIGAANVHGNARSIATLQSIISHSGSINGKQFLRPETIEQIFRTQSDGIDQVLMTPVKFGIGYALPDQSTPHLPVDRKICYWGGWGGSSIVNVLDRRMTVAYMMNRMDEGLLGDVRGQNLVAAALAAAG
jgi:CubicO group peptidase (beta-lactamase class C family)